MKFATPVVSILAGMLSLSPFAASAAVTAPADWVNTRLANDNTVSNEFYFWPGSSGEPNILTTGSTGTYMLQNGGPPTWTAFAVQPNLATLSGEFFPNGASGSVLVNLSSGSITAVIFGNSGPTVTLVASGVTALHAISCMTDAAGDIHLAYGYTTTGGNEYIGYAQKPPTGGWTASSLFVGTGYNISGTNILATSLTSVKVFFNVGYTSGGVPQYAMKDVTLAGKILKLDSTNVDTATAGPIVATRTGSTVFYYCRLAAAAGPLDVWKLDPTTGTTTDIASLTTVNIRNMFAATGPDGKDRLVVYDASTGIVDYIKVDDGTVGKVVDLSGTLTGADVRGLDFDSDGTPYVLYRKSLTEAYVAYPAENQDANGNGRADVVDTALRGPNNGVTALSIAEDVTGATGAVNHFKVQFPVVGTPVATANVLKNSGQNLQYTLQISSDLQSWVGATNVKFFFSGAANAKTATAVFSDDVPGTLAQKYVRVAVARITSPF